MRVLLLYPVFPKTMFSFEKPMKYMGKKALLPPLGLITVAAILPQNWEFKLVDRNIRDVTEEEWEWAELVMISAMVVQKKDFLDQIQETKRRGKPVAVGGPYPTSFLHEVENSGADYLVLDEGEMTIPPFLAALERGEPSGIFRSVEKPDITQTPLPRYDLLELDAYLDMSIQFSRGCPFLCEFCDIIVLYGRKPRTKTPAQIIRELECLYDLGWRDQVFMVDDNFIGNKRNVKQLLRELKVWMEKKHYPFFFYTEASVNLAKEQELMELMVACNFVAVFLGIETPDESILASTKKSQNLGNPLNESIKAINQAGLFIIAGFVIGFDGEKSGTGKRIVEFVEEVAIPTALLVMLQALPNTALWDRLQKEGRLLEQSGDINQTTLMNFVPTRPVEEVANEYVEAFWQLYEPKKYLNRAIRHTMNTEISKIQKTIQKKRQGGSFSWKMFKVSVFIFWKFGVVDQTRWQFWSYLFKAIWLNPSQVENCVRLYVFAEHFADYRQIIRDEINAQLNASSTRRK
ncbi:MAG: B12-binding domain-containing radical SAM protein [Candidatus Parabeggiatoa sp.]|nr:B12-binding domain-containing radical SAM protein [Candidatus Parabeggiatoa sp.]